MGKKKKRTGHHCAQILTLNDLCLLVDGRNLGNSSLKFFPITKEKKQTPGINFWGLLMSSTSFVRNSYVDPIGSRLMRQCVHGGQGKQQPGGFLIYHL